MNSRILKWVPVTFAIAALAGIMMRLVVSSQSDVYVPENSVSQIDHDPAWFDAPVFPMGQAVIAASNEEPLFSEAMQYYRRGDYASASFALRQATARQPENQEIRFFSWSVLPARERHESRHPGTEGCGKLGASPYVDRIHFYLAKAFLRQKDTINALRELNALVDNGGTLSESAKKLKFELTNSSYSE